eukprot:5595657-Pyramimonas_sp.AAC.1
MYLAARGALKTALMPSAVQSLLFKQWCWAKDVAMTTAQYRAATDELTDTQLTVDPLEDGDDRAIGKRRKLFTIVESAPAVR